MAIIKNNALLKGASGKLGETHSYRTVRGQLQMVNLPSERKGLSPAQQVTVSRFVKASRFANGVKNNPAVLAEYQKRTTTKLFSAYLVAVKDSMTSPVVHYIKADDYTGKIGETITIKATDDFKVVRVTVTILNSKGKTIERGDATRMLRKPTIWKYQTTVANPKLKGTVIRVKAVDIPENESELEITV